MSATLSLVLAALTATPLASREPAPAQPTSLIATWIRAQSEDRPRVSVWVNRDDPYQRGDDARVYFKSDRDAYVTVIRIDTDGRMRVLFPIDPWEDNFARGGRTFEVLGRDRDEAFRVDDYPGVGYIFAIASPDEFRYDDLVRGDHWDYRTISDGRVRGDPYVAVSDLADRIAQEDDYDYDVTSYDVERHYDYPRFVCYDCHTYASWHYWDPYSSYCSRFQIVIYDDWYYYPYRRYRGGVYVGRPYRPGPRYVFKDYDKRNDYITRVAERPRGGDPVRRTSADVGGRGSIPTPVSPRRRTDDGNRGAEPGRAPSNDPRRRTEGGNRPDANRPDASPSQEPRRRTDDNGNRPEAGRPDQGSGQEPRRRGTDNGGRPENPAPDRQPSNQLREDRPERRTIEDRPSRDDGASSERRGRRSRDDGSNPGLSEPRVAPDRARPNEPRFAPDRARPSEPRATTREPRREPRSQPRAEPRSEPRSAPRSEPRQSPP
ncbi:MAG TPA: DUF4384 domain-containing protein, partial [Gemmatimonadales bacterium]|nr:DUF4384 domain-containing protein [Gemmatimonadales bacterium]